jgi:lipopolysaccharide export system permease protein
MGSLNWYIFRTTFGAFAIVLVSLTAVIWVTQALRDIDLLTSQGQTVLVFIGITGMIVPLLVMIIAPIALLIAVVHTLNKMSTDSELIVINGAGVSPFTLFRAFLNVAIIVAIAVSILSAYVAPQGLRKLRDWLTAVSADLVANIVQPGRFTTIEGGLTIHIRERAPGGQLLGVFVDDQRNPQERITILAEKGETLENANGKFLLLQTGSVQRHEAGERDPAVVVFDRYAFDLSRFTGSTGTVKYSVRERYIWQLLYPDSSDALYKEQPAQFRAELHDRLVAPLYPIAFVIIAFAYLGPAQTTRQTRTGALLGAISAVATLRLIGFAATVFGVQVPIALAVPYIALISTIGAGLYVIKNGIVIEPPAVVTRAINSLSDRLNRAMAPS